MAFLDNDSELMWFVMRDLKRYNAKEPAYKLLEGMNMETFVPMKWHLATRKGKRVREEIPFIQDLLFVHETRLNLDPVVAKTPTLQYRWMRNTYRKPMTIPDTVMERFIQVVNSSESPKYYLPEEVVPAMYGNKIRIVGGHLDGYEGNLLTTRGSKIKRLLVKLNGLLAVSVEVSPEYIQFI